MIVTVSDSKGIKQYDVHDNIKKVIVSVVVFLFIVIIGLSLYAKQINNKLTKLETTLKTERIVEIKSNSTYAQTIPQKINKNIQIEEKENSIDHQKLATLIALENKRIEKKAKKEKLAKAKKKKEALAKAEKLRVEKEKKEKLAKLEKIKKEKAQKEKLAKAKRKKEALAKAEKLRIEKEKKEKLAKLEKIKKEKAQKEKLAKAKKKKEALAKAEKLRIEKKKKEKLAKAKKKREAFAKAKKLRLKKEKIKKEKLAKVKKLRSDKKLSQHIGKKEKLLPKIAKSKLGRRYVWGAIGPRNFDCSGFTSYVYRKTGISIPRTSRQQSRYGKLVDRKHLKPGDLIFFDTSRRRKGVINHVGMYIGNNQFIHASSAKKRVVITSLNQNFYSQRFKWARRVVN